MTGARANCRRRAAARSATRLAWVFAGLLASCGPRAASPAEALDAARPRLGAFEEFDAWARATLAAEPSDPRSRAFHELLFSPLQNDPDVVAAWIVREGANPRAWELADVPSPASESLTSVVAPRLGPLRVGLVDLDDPRTREADRVPTLVVTRRQRASESAIVEVSVAYAR